MKHYRITIAAIIMAPSQVEAEKLALAAVEDYLGTEAYIENENICNAGLDTVVEDREPSINMPDR